MTITPLHPKPDASIYRIDEPDAMHPCIGWYYETPAGYYKGPFQTDTEAAIEAAKEITNEH